MINLKKDEKIELIKRRHWIIFVLELFPIKLILVSVLFFLFYFLFAFPTSWENFLVDNINFFSEISIKYLFLLIVSCFLLILWQIVFLIILQYILDTWIVTNKRTIHFELTSLFHRKYSSIDHNKIQDITVKFHGILPTLFKYGNLRIQTAGSFKEFIFKQIPNPLETKEIIIKMKDD